MRFFKVLLTKLGFLMTWFKALPLLPKIIVGLMILALIGFGYSKFFGRQTAKTQYQTEVVAKGTIIVSVTASGQVSSANMTPVSTKATGVVSKVYVQDGDTVKSGDKLAEIDLDLPGKQTAAQALAAYQSAQNSLDSAKNDLLTTQADMFGKWNTFFNLATNSTYQNSDGTPNNINRALAEFHVADNTWLAAEQKYKNQQNVIGQAQSNTNSAWLTYQQSSPTVYAPISGTITGFSLREGSVIGSAPVSTKIASIKTEAMPEVVVNLSEIDAPKVKVGNKVTLTFDAFSGKTFTGKVVSVDTSGSVSSGVTTYPAFILLDTEVPGLMNNMSAQANIISETKDGVLLVPSSAVQSQTDQSFVRILKNGQPSQVAVETGLTSATEVEIVSGLLEGDTVVTGTIAASPQTSGTGSQTQSPFGSFGGGLRGGGFSGGGGRNGR